ncbi:MAG: hypothetical protein RR538_06595 [Erysipelotrichaceae bacterium]
MKQMRNITVFSLIVLLLATVQGPTSIQAISEVLKDETNQQSEKKIDYAISFNNEKSSATISFHSCDENKYQITSLTSDKGLTKSDDQFLIKENDVYKFIVEWIDLKASEQVTQKEVIDIDVSELVKKKDVTNNDSKQRSEKKLNTVNSSMSKKDPITIATMSWDTLQSDIDRLQDGDFLSLENVNSYIESEKTYTVGKSISIGVFDGSSKRAKNLHFVIENNSTVTFTGLISENTKNSSQTIISGIGNVILNGETSIWGPSSNIADAGHGINVDGDVSVIDQAGVSGGDTTGSGRAGSAIISTGTVSIESVNREVKGGDSYNATRPMDGADAIVAKDVVLKTGRITGGSSPELPGLKSGSGVNASNSIKSIEPANLKPLIVRTNGSSDGGSGIKCPGEINLQYGLFTSTDSPLTGVGNTKAGSAIEGGTGRITLHGRLKTADTWDSSTLQIRAGSSGYNMQPYPSIVTNGDIYISGETFVEGGSYTSQSRKNADSGHGIETSGDIHIESGQIRGGHYPIGDASNQAGNAINKAKNVFVTGGEIRGTGNASLPDRIISGNAISNVENVYISGNASVLGGGSVYGTSGSAITNVGTLTISENAKVGIETIFFKLRPARPTVINVKGGNALVNIDKVILKDNASVTGGNATKDAAGGHALYDVKEVLIESKDVVLAGGNSENGIAGSAIQTNNDLTIKKGILKGGEKTGLLGAGGSAIVSNGLVMIDEEQKDSVQISGGTGKENIGYAVSLKDAGMMILLNGNLETTNKKGSVSGGSYYVDLMGNTKYFTSSESKELYELSLNPYENELMEGNFEEIKLNTKTSRKNLTLRLIAKDSKVKITLNHNYITPVFYELTRNATGLAEYMKQSDPVKAYGMAQTDNSLEFMMPSKNLKIEKKIQDFMILFEIDGNGSMDGTLKHTLAAGSKFPVLPVVKPNDGYKFDGWFKDGKKVMVMPEFVEGNEIYVAKLTKIEAIVPKPKPDVKPDIKPQPVSKPSETIVVAEIYDQPVKNEEKNDKDETVVEKEIISDSTLKDGITLEEKKTCYHLPLIIMFLVISLMSATLISKERKRTIDLKNEKKI